MPRVKENRHASRESVPHSDMGEKRPAFKKTILDFVLVPIYDAGQKTNIKISQNS